MADFPRGGGSSLTPLEAQRIRDSAMQDVLFGSTVEKKTRKEKPKKVLKVSRSDKSESFDPNGNLKFTDSLTFKKLVVGMKILGCIQEIQLAELIVNLPNSLNGFVPITNIHNVLTDQLKKSLNPNTGDEDEDTSAEMSSIKLHDLFHVGQFVPTVVKEIDSSKHGYKKVVLSVDPKDLNAKLKVKLVVENMPLWGFVSSVEDHGCIVSFGVKDFTGFVLKESIGSLQLGSTQWFLVRKVNGRVVTVGTDENEVIAAKYKDDDNLTFNALHPGALMNAVITKVFSGGVSIESHGFKGGISILHLPGHGLKSEKKIKENKQLLCRIIYISPESKMLGLSATNGITSLSSDLNSDSSIGLIQQCTVVKDHSIFGLLVELQDGKKAFAHLSRISDGKGNTQKIGKKYKAGTSHQCRIVGYNGLDGLYVVSLQKSVIEKPFLRYADIRPGMIVTGTILTLEDFGMIVKLSDHIKGLCGRVHLADIILKHPEKKLVDGKSVTCRVLSVNAEKKRLKLTHKKTLVTSELPIITDYHEVTRGMKVHGYIDRIGEFGLIVRFYNGVKGLAPLNRLGLQEGEKIDEIFFVGQVLKCTVLHCNPHEKKLKLTLQSDAEFEALSLNSDFRQVAPSPFTIVQGDIIEVKKDEVNVQLQNGPRAVLKMEHLSDFKCNQEDFAFVYQVALEKCKKTVEDFVYLGEQRKRHIVSFYLGNVSVLLLS